LTAAYSAWLPDEVFNSSGALAVFDGAVKTWSDRWFSASGFKAEKIWLDAKSAHPVVATGLLAAVRLKPETASELAGRALGFDLSRLEATADDQKVLDGFLLALFQDLVDALDDALISRGAEPDAPSTRADLLSVILNDGAGRAVATIEAPKAQLIQALLNALPPPRPATGTLTSLTEACADVLVDVKVRIGAALIALPDARRLAPGDVVVLDRRVDQAMDVVAGGDGARLAGAELVDASSPRSVRLQTAAAGTSQ